VRECLPVLSCACPLEKGYRQAEGVEMKVLLVDDEPVFRTYIKNMNLWKEGEFQLYGEAGNGDEALLFLERKAADIVILDVSMPGKNGVVLSGILSKLYPRTAIMAVSSFDDYDYVRELLKNGAHDYILKSRLSEELLLFTLKNMKARIKERSPWEIKSGLRRQASAWIWENGVSPFTSDNSRMVASIITVQHMRNDTWLRDEGILEGIGKIGEAVSTDSMDVLACVMYPGSVVLLTRFYDTVSEGEMRNQMTCNQVVIEDSVLRLYHLRIKMYQCPFFFNEESLKSFLLHKLEEAMVPEKEEAALALSLGQYKQLLSVAEKHDPDQAEQLVRMIYEDIPLNQDGRCLMVTKELLEIIQRISNEYQLKLDFLPREFMLFQYARVKSRDTLVSNIAGLYQNVLREIREMKKAEQGFSQVVNQAIDYQNKHFHEPISLRVISDYIGVSSSYLSRIFREETDFTITEHLNNIRIERAKKLLEENLPLKDIVYRCGFRNYGYFLRTFKEYTGLTPKEYIAQNKG